MGRRLQPRVKGVLPVRIWGTDREGKPFTEHVCTVDISNKGASLAAVRARLSPGDTLGLRYRNRQARFRVIRVSPAAAGQGRNVGLECLQPEKEFWPVDTPTEGADPYIQPEARLSGELTARENRRAHTRYPVSGAAFVSTINGDLRLWAKLGDISLTGCYVHTAEPMDVGRSLSLLIKLAGQEFEAVAIVRSCFHGLAMGLEFTFMSNADRCTLRSVIARLKESDTVPV